MEAVHDYKNKSILYRIKQRWTNALKGKRRRIKVDMWVKEYASPRMIVEGVKSVGYFRQDKWTDEPAEQLNRDGYLKCTGLYDSILFWGVPVYLRVHGLHQFDIHATDDAGRFLYSQDTAATLNDAMTSSATKDFIKGMAKTQMSAMDTQKIIMIAMLGAGAIFGLWILGVF